MLSTIRQGGRMAMAAAAKKMGSMPPKTFLSSPTHLAASYPSSVMRSSILLQNCSMRWTFGLARGHTARPFSRSSLEIVQASQRSLNDIVKLDMLVQENAGRIIEIWMQYHSAKKDAAASVLSRPEYDTLTFRIKKCPFVILPVHRNEGYVAFLVQFKEQRAFVTMLEEFKAKGEHAEPLLVWSLHPDMLEEKGMALARADFMEKSMTKEEANKLIADLTFCYVDSHFFKDVMRLNQATHFDWNEFVQKLSQRHNP